MTPQHTPGPWRLHEQATDRIIVNGSCVYRVRDMTVNEDGQYGKPHAADMALIAAAPELLEVCKELFMQMRREGGGYQQMLERTLAAIAKAEGRSE